MTAGPSLACRAAVHGDAYTIPYRGTAGMVFVDDVAAAYEHALISEPDGARVFNICGELASNEQIVDEIRRIVPDAKLSIDGPDTGIARDINDDPLFAAFPSLPRTSLRDGIARTVEFYRRQRLNA
jgi:nucleoside-diphosphate-sugar epimerase